MDFQNCLRKMDPNAQIPDVDSLTTNSINDRIMRVAGRTISNTVHITTGGGAGNAVNLFSFSGGPFKINAFLFLIHDVTNIADFTDVGLDVYDGVVDTKLSARNPGGAVCSGFGLNSILFLAAVATVAIDALNSNQTRIGSQPARGAYQEVFVSPKYGVTSYIRLRYDSAGIDITGTAGLMYVDSPGFSANMAAV